MNNKAYDILKWLALVAFDAVGLFYKTIAEIWATPYGDQVLNTCVAVSVLLGTLIGVSGMQYQKSWGEEDDEEEEE